MRFGEALFAFCVGRTSAQGWVRLWVWLGLITLTAWTGSAQVLQPDAFVPFVDGIVRASVPQPDGRVIIAGDFTTVGGVSRNRVARLNADGSVDAEFDPNANGTVVYGTVFSVSVQADGKILLGGQFTTVGGLSRNYVARLNADGSVDTGFNPNANGTVYSLSVQSDGKILLGGNFTTVRGLSRNNVARLNADGSVDSGFNPNANDDVYSLSVQTDGKILMGGNFTTVGGVSRTMWRD